MIQRNFKSTFSINFGN